MEYDKLMQLERSLNLTGYTRNKIKSMGNELSNTMSQIEILSSMVDENLLSEELYTNFIARKKKEIKDIVAEIYGNLRLSEVEGHMDHVFDKSKTENGGK